MLRQLKLRFVSILGAVLFMLSITSGASAEQVVASSEKTSRSAFPVYTDVVHYELVRRTLHTSGKLANKSQQRLSFKTSGRVKNIYVDEGEYVKQGQLLAELDQEQISAQVKQAKSLDLDAQRQLRRLRQLYKRKAVSQVQLQTAETNAEVTASNLRIIKFNQKHATIKAPVSGTVLRRMMEENEFVSSFQPTVILGAKEQGWVIRSLISDKSIVRVHVGDPAVIQFDAYPGIPFKGFVSEVAAAANEHNQLFEIEIALDPVDQRLHAGFIGQIQITPESVDRIAWVPIAAVVEADMGKAKLFKVLPDNKVTLREVTVGWLDSGKVAVRDGVDDASHIVTGGATFLSEGTLISSLN